MVHAHIFRFLPRPSCSRLPGPRALSLLLNFFCSTFLRGFVPRAFLQISDCSAHFQDSFFGPGCRLIVLGCCLSRRGEMIRVVPWYPLPRLTVIAGLHQWRSRETRSLKVAFRNLMFKNKERHSVPWSIQCPKPPEKYECDVKLTQFNFPLFSKSGPDSLTKTRVFSHFPRIFILLENIIIWSPNMKMNISHMSADPSVHIKMFNSKSVFDFYMKENPLLF